MKKIIILLIVFAALALTGCTDKANISSTEFEQLKKQVSDLSEENNKLNSDIAELEAIINSKNSKDDDETSEIDIMSKYPMYAQWISVNNIAFSERYIYLSVVSGVAEMQKEISNKWYDDGTKQLLSFITGVKISENASSTEILSIYDKLKSPIGKSGYSIMDTLDPDEDSAWRIFYFLQIINDIEDNKFNGKNLVNHSTAEEYLYSINGFNFNMKELANALGVNLELVDIIVHASIDSGFNVTFDGYNVKA